MRALAALLALLPLVLSVRVFHDPFDLHALARQATHDGVPKVPPQFNINSGGPEIGRFVPDAPEWILGDTSAFIDDDAIIGGAEDKNLPMYKSHRFGLQGATWGYNIPVMEPGIYGCTAHFAELFSEAFITGHRVFNLHFATANGDVRNFENIDVFDELGGAEFTVLTKTAENLVVTGILSIRLKAIAGDAMLSGLTCERTADLPPGVEPDFDTDPRVPTAPVTDTDTGTDTSDPMQDGVPVSGTEININCGGEAVGRFSAEDYSWIRGKTSQWEGPPGVSIGGAEEKNEPAVKSHRYGQDASDWGYVIPLDNPGIYDCSLHFSETDSQSFEVRARVFDLMIMDRKLEDVDIYRDAAMAPFTAVVKTFTDLAVPTHLTIDLKAKIGNAFISAITCEKTGSLMIPDGPDVKESPGEDMTEQPSPPVTDPSFAPSPGTPVESPMPTPATIFPGTETPVTEPSEPALEPTPIAYETSTVEGPEESTPPALQSPAVSNPQETPGASIDTPVSEEATIDDPLEQLDGTFIQRYELLATVSNGIFTEVIKDALVIVSTDAITVPSTFVMTALKRTETIAGTARRLLKIVLRQDEDTNIYIVTLQGRHEVSDPTETTIQYSEFVENEADERLKERGVDNVSVKLRSSQTISQAVAESNTTNTSLIVGVTVGCVLGALVVVALVAFFVVNRKRNNEPSAAAFDAPPPPMTESEMSSVRERSETGASVEYLDDDSTFTAATSRAGDHVDQVGFVKDVFGRGTADGAHGSS